jgi:hypothetical protein
MPDEQLSQRGVVAPATAAISSSSFIASLLHSSGHRFRKDARILCERARPAGGPTTITAGSSLS